MKGVQKGVRKLVHMWVQIGGSRFCTDPLSVDQVITSRYCIELLIHLLPAAGLLYEDILLNFHPLLSADQVITSRYFIELLIHLLPHADQVIG